jgi:hypothetical protein
MLTGACFRSHRDRVVAIFRASGITAGTIFLASPPAAKEAYTGCEKHFIQEPLFFWLSGWPQPDSALAIGLATSRSTLYTPLIDAHYRLWSGDPTLDSILRQTGVDDVVQTAELPTPRPPVFGGSPGQDSPLLAASSIARRVKEPHEIACLRSAASATSDALAAAIQISRPGVY